MSQNESRFFEDMCYGNTTEPCELFRKAQREQIQAMVAHRHIVTYTYLIGVPITCVPGIIVSCVSLILFVKQIHRKSASHSNRSLYILMTGLTIYDLLVLVSAIATLPGCGWCFVSENKAECGYCNVALEYIRPIISTAQCASVWTCVAMTIDRLLAIKFPMKSRSWCTASRSIYSLIWITIFSIAFRFPCWLEFDDNGPSALRKNKTYQSVYKWYATLIVLFIIPWIVMLVLNAIVYVAVRQALQKRHIMTKGYNGTQNSRQNNTMAMSQIMFVYLRSEVQDNGNANGSTRASTTSHHGSKGGKAQRKSFRMALFVIVTFLVLYLPAFACNLLEAFQWKPQTYITYCIYQLMIFGGNLLVCVNSATNFLIYYATGDWFRTLFAETFLCAEKPHRHQTGLTQNALHGTKSHATAVDNNSKEDRKPMMKRHLQWSSVRTTSRDHLTVLSKLSMNRRATHVEGHCMSSVSLELERSPSPTEHTVLFNGTDKIDTVTRKSSVENSLRVPTDRVIQCDQSLV